MPTYDIPTWPAEAKARTRHPMRACRLQHILHHRRVETWTAMVPHMLHASVVSERSAEKCNESCRLGERQRGALQCSVLGTKPPN